MNTQGVVHVVDDDAEARGAAVSLVEAMGAVAHGYNSAEEFLQAYDGHRPACLVSDVRMAGMSGLDLQEELIRRDIAISVVMVTAFPTTPSTVRAMQNGALTLLEKPCRDDELWEAIRKGLAADRQLDKAKRLRDLVSEREASLTAKEHGVLVCIMAGERNKAIAHKLGVSVRTIEVHRRHVFEKMGAKSLAELVRTVASARSIDRPIGMSRPINGRMATLGCPVNLQAS